MARDSTNPGSDPERRQGGVGTARQQAAAGRTANARRIGRAPLFAFVAGLALLLGTMPQDARAKACKQVGLRAGCVTASDIKKGPGRLPKGDLTARDRKDEAGQAFDAPRKSSLINFFSVGQGATVVFATVKTKIPAGGVVLVTANAVLAADTAETFGAVECDLIVQGPSPINRRVIRRALFGSVDARDGLSFDSMAYMTGLTPAKKAKLRFDLACGITQGLATNAVFGNGRILLQEVSVAVQYFPTRY